MAMILSGMSTGAYDTLYNVMFSSEMLSHLIVMLVKLIASTETVELGVSMAVI